MNKNDKSVMYNIASFIVNKRNLFFLLFIFAGIFSIFSIRWVKIEEDITKYLPKNTETRIGVDLMNKEFTTYATADIMVSNISYDRAVKAAEKLEKLDGVQSVAFDNSSEHFKKASALFTVTFDYEIDNPKCESSFNNVKKNLSEYDIYISSDIGYSETKSLNKDIVLILVISAIIIIGALLLTSRSYAEVPVLLITFSAAALLNMGTNFLCGKISYISNSVSVVLQLALAIDYAIILCHRYSEEHENLPSREAAIAALAKAIPEISSSSLTTVSGLLALATMHFKIGQDLSVVLVKAILLSLLSVFALMPGLLVIFSKKIDSTKHKNFIPKISALGKFVVKTRLVLPPIFALIVIAAFFLSGKCPYCFGNNYLSTPRKDERQIARDKINSTFDRKNMLAVVIPSGDYEKEAALLADFESRKEVKQALGLANTEAMNGYMLTDSLTPREFSELTEIDYEAAAMLYAANAFDKENYGEIISDIGNYSVPLIDMLDFVHKEAQKKYIALDDDLTESINDIYEKISNAKKQLQSKSYTRLLVYLDLPDEGEKTFAFLDTMHEIASKYYPPEDIYLVGNSTSDRDLSSSFDFDNIIISILSALFVVTVLLFTFMSAGLPILLIAVIQGSIWINFSFPYLMNSKLFFLGYLIVSSIQMGANIDYAIVISSRYSALKQEMNSKEAAIEALNQAFPTILTSGVILASAGILIGQLTTNGVISSMGMCLGRGTVISIILVMTVLPQILLLGDAVIERTSFRLKKPDLIQKGSGTVFVNGRVRGYVSGIIDANVHGVIKGDVSALVQSGNIDIAEDINAEKKESETNE